MALQRLNIEQERAKAAFDFAEKSSKSSSYSSYVNKLPMYILTNGLINALAFAHSKNEWKQLYDDIKSWLQEKDPQALIKDKFTKDKSLIEVVIGLDTRELRLVTSEVLSLLTWLRRFAIKEE